MAFHFLPHYAWVAALLIKRARGIAAIKRSNERIKRGAASIKFCTIFKSYTNHSHPRARSNKSNVTETSVPYCTCFFCLFDTSPRTDDVRSPLDPSAYRLIISFLGELPLLMLVAICTKSFIANHGNDNVRYQSNWKLISIQLQQETMGTIVCWRRSRRTALRFVQLI